MNDEERKPRILVFDIETAPIRAFVWALWDQNIAVNQMEADWHLLSWAAKWLHSPVTIYMDQRDSDDIENDKKMLEVLWNLLSEADVVVTQNGKRFDVKKVNARFAIHGMKPPAPYKQIDTRELAKKYFGFTANSLEYLAERLCGKKKEKSRKFIGFELWRECLRGNVAAWDEMEKYNRADVLATEELYLRLAPWGTGVDLNPYYGDIGYRCHCGSERIQRRGFSVTTTGKFQKYQCGDCGSWMTARGKENNLLSSEKRQSLKKPRG